MADIIRPRDLPVVTDGVVNPAAALVVDNGLSVQRATPAQLVDAATPLASQAAAEAGTSNDGRMSPLRVQQAISALTRNAIDGASLLALSIGSLHLTKNGSEGGRMDMSYANNSGLWIDDVDAANTRRTLRSRSDGSVLVASRISETTGKYDFLTLPTIGAVPLKTALTLGNVDNTSDADKPISTAQAGALATKVNSASLAVSTGAALVSTKRSGMTAAEVRTLASKVADRFDLRDVIGCDVAGNNASTSAMQAAVLQASSDGVDLHIPLGKIVLDAPILIKDGIAIRGGLASVGRAVAGYASGAAVGPTSRFHFAHSGIGFRCGDGTMLYDGVSFRDIMTSRDQPVPTSTVGSFTPNDHDYDFVMQSMSGLTLENMLLLNPSRAVNMLGGGGIGRLFMDNVLAQPLITGVNVELAADVVRLSNMHFWPIWRDHLEVNRWTINNADHIYFKRCDTPILSNIFSIAARSMLRIGRNSFGGTTKLKMTNYDCDYSQKCIWFDSNAQNSWARLTNGTLQANNAGEGSLLANIPASPVRSNVTMEGASCFLMLDGVEMAGANGSAIKLTGANNRLEVSSDFWLQEYGATAGNTEPGILCNAGNTFITTNRILNTKPGLGLLTGGAGTFIGIRQVYAPGVMSQTGAPTDLVLNAADCVFLNTGNRVTGSATFTVGAAGQGTSSGYVRVSLPTTVDYTFYPKAIDLSVSENLTAVSIQGQPGMVQISRVDGSPVIKNGRTIGVTFEYALKD